MLEGPTSSCPLCPHSCPVMCLAKDCYCCSSSSVLNNPDNPSSDPLPHPHVGSGWGWERLRESKNSAKVFPTLTRAAHRAQGETPPGQRGVCQLVLGKLREKDLAGARCRQRRQAQDSGPGSVLTSGLEIRDCQDTRAEQGALAGWGPFSCLTGDHGSKNRTSAA